jgi:hypothetical protein
VKSRRVNEGGVGKGRDCSRILPEPDQRGVRVGKNLERSESGSEWHVTRDTGTKD